MPSATVDLSTPASAPVTLCDALNRGDLDVACGCFTRDAYLITPDGTAVRGRGAIGGILAQLIATGAEISIEVSAIIAAGDVALAHQRWHLQSSSPAGSWEQDSSPRLVLQRVESQWKLAIAAPWGWGG